MTKKVMIDPGHAPGNQNKGPTGYFEHAGMWALSNHLKRALERCGVKADLTRTERQDPTLAQRGAKARGYDLFISEHSNAFNATVRGCEVFYSVRQTANRKHAAAISAASAKLMGNPDRGAKTRRGNNGDWFGVIRAAVAAGCPHVYLAESGFHTNRTDEAWLKKDSNLKALAEKHAEVICGILGVKYLTTAAPSPAKLPEVRRTVGIEVQGKMLKSTSGLFTTVGTMIPGALLEDIFEALNLTFTGHGDHVKIRYDAPGTADIEALEKRLAEKEKKIAAAMSALK